MNLSDNDEQQKLYFNNGTEEATIMGADMEVINVKVPSSGYNNVEGPDENVGKKSKSNKEQTEEGTNKSKISNNTKTEEATSMEADTEAIGIEAKSGLLNHVVGFHAKGVVASKSMEEETNKLVNSKCMFEKEENDENATNMENNKEKGGTVNVDKEQTIGVKKPIMKDNLEFDDGILEEEDTMDGNKGKTEESTNKARDTTNNPETGGISLFGVGGNRNENQQKNRTNIITSSSIKSKEEEQEHIIASLVTKSVLDILDDESLDNDVINCLFSTNI